ncbi:MAG: WxL domain-containing protein, partial [Bombilactobacillus sp.]|nr:WxL domain-containing protein [Bombilactobacillus sp.]
SNGELNNVKNGWTLTVQVSDFRLKTPDRPDGDPDTIQPIAYMNFNSARLLHGNFKGPITEDAIKNKQFDLKAATNGYPGAPTNNIVGTDSDTKSISIVPEQPGTTIWSAQSNSIQGKSIWGLAFNSEKDVDLETPSLGSQLTGDYIAKLTWTLSTVPVT